MTRRRIALSQKLTCKIGLRVSRDFFEKLETVLPHSNHRSVAALTREILYGQEIQYRYIDATMDAVCSRLVFIRTDLNKIGVNINQVVKYFNSTGIHSEKVNLALTLLDEYKKVGEMIDEIKPLIGELSKKWLRE